MTAWKDKQHSQVAELVDAKANSYVEASLNNTFPGSWLALAAGTKAYRFESCPDYKTKA